jgi:hypothetical protein
MLPDPETQSGRQFRETMKCRAGTDCLVVNGGWIDRKRENALVRVVFFFPLPRDIVVVTLAVL